jgi:hypothetical protein
VTDEIFFQNNLRGVIGRIIVTDVFENATGVSCLTGVTYDHVVKRGLAATMALQSEL